MPSPDTNPGPWPSEGHALLLSYEGIGGQGPVTIRPLGIFSPRANPSQLLAHGGVTCGSPTRLAGATFRCLGRSAKVTLRGPLGPIGDPAGSRTLFTRVVRDQVLNRHPPQPLGSWTNEWRREWDSNPRTRADLRGSSSVPSCARPSRHGVVVWVGLQPTYSSFVGRR